MGSEKRKNLKGEIYNCVTARSEKWSELCKGTEDTDTRGRCNSKDEQMEQNTPCPVTRMNPQVEKQQINTAHTR